MDLFEALSYSPKGAFVVVDFALVLLGTVANCLVLTGIVRGTFKLSGYKRFLLSLTLGDMYMCCVNSIILVFDAVTSYRRKALLWVSIFRGMQMVGFFGNLFNLCGISIDHFVGVIYPHKYNYLSKKVLFRRSTVSLWIVAVILGLSEIPKSIYVQLTSESFDEQSEIEAADVIMDTDAGCADAVALFANTVSGVDATQFRELYDLMNQYLSDQSEVTTMSTLPSSSRQIRHSRSAVTTFPKLSTRKRGALQMRGRKVLNSSRSSSPASSTTIAPELTDAAKSGSSCFIGNSSKAEMAVKEAFNHTLPTGSDSIDANRRLEYVVMTICFCCLVFLTVCYGKIFKQIFENKRNRKIGKLVATTCMFIGSFVICWIPFVTFELVMLFLAQHFRLDVYTWTSLYRLHDAFMTLLMCYPLLDAVIYGARVPAVRRLLMSKKRQRQLAQADPSYFGPNTEMASSSSAAKTSMLPPPSPYFVSRKLTKLSTVQTPAHLPSPSPSDSRLDNL